MVASGDVPPAQAVVLSVGALVASGDPVPRAIPSADCRGAPLCARPFAVLGGTEPALSEAERVPNLSAVAVLGGAGL